MSFFEVGLVLEFDIRHAFFCLFDVVLDLLDFHIVVVCFPRMIPKHTFGHLCVRSLFELFYFVLDFLSPRLPFFQTLLVARELLRTLVPLLVAVYAVVEVLLLVLQLRDLLREFRRIAVVEELGGAR